MAVFVYYSSLPYEKANNYKSKTIAPIVAPIFKVVIYPVTFFDNCERYSLDKCKPWCNATEPSSSCRWCNRLFQKTVCSWICKNSDA